MALKRVNKYVTSDGREFDIRSDAEKHQKRIDAYTGIKSLTHNKNLSNLVADLTCSPELVQQWIAALTAVQRYQNSQVRNRAELAIAS